MIGHKISLNALPVCPSLLANDSLHSTFSFHFLLGHGLKVKKRWVTKDFSFLRSFLGMHGALKMLSLLDPWRYVGAFKGYLLLPCSPAELSSVSHQIAITCWEYPFSRDLQVWTKVQFCLRVLFTAQKAIGSHCCLQFCWLLATEFLSWEGKGDGVSS